MKLRYFRCRLPLSRRSPAPAPTVCHPGKRVAFIREPALPFASIAPRRRPHAPFRRSSRPASPARFRLGIPTTPDPALGCATSAEFLQGLQSKFIIQKCYSSCGRMGGVLMDAATANPAKIRQRKLGRDNPM